MSDSTTFSFTFRTAKVVLSHPNAQSFLAPVLSALRALLPAQNAYCIHAPAGMLIPSSTPQPTQFVDLFISFCHSMNLTINDNLIVNFKRTLLKKQPLEILQVSFDKNILQAICRALIFVRTVKDLKIGGFTFSDLYLDITRILMNNNTLETLKVVNYTKKKNFSDFILSMPRSSIKSLTFQSITFQRSMIQSLVNSICISPNLKHIGFVNCGFDSFVFGAIFDTPENFKNIESFEISKDESEISLSFIPNIISFILVAGITSLNLTEMALDIALVFSSIENTPDLEIHTLNLSGNYCSKLYKRGYTFPHTFEILKLAEVRWDGQTLCDFLTMQHFKSEISLDLSSVSFPGSTESEPFELLNGKIFSTKVSKFIWNNNFLTPTFLKFIEKNESIRVLSYEMCSIPLDARNDFLEALSNFISNSSVTYLSLRGSLRTFKSKAIYALKKSFIKHDLFEELNISDNVFCDKGIEALGEIISQSNNIQYIKCDGEDPSSPDLYINFLNSIAKSKTLTKVSKPRNDIMKLISKSRSSEQSLRIAWKRANEAMRDRTTQNMLSFKPPTNYMKTMRTTISENQNHNNSTLNISKNMELNDGINDSKAAFDLWPSSMLDASWELTIELGYNGSREEWVKMSEEFTIENIIGINEVEDNDQSDLIDLS